MGGQGDEKKAKTSTIVLVGLGVAMTVLLTAGFVYTTMRLTAPQQSTHQGSAGAYGYGPGAMGSFPYYSGGMMGGYGGSAGGRGMMGGYAWTGQLPGYSGTYPCPLWNGTATGLY